MHFIDLTTQQARIKADVDKRIAAVLAHGTYIMGPEIRELEEKLAAFVGCKHCLSCSSGTDALLLALMAYDVKPGDAIFTTPFTFIATAEVISLLGATPIFVDIDERTFNIDPVKLEASITNLRSGRLPSSGTSAELRVRGIIPVDLFGLPADYDAINAVARKHGLFVLEDACQGFGGSYKNRRAGSLADVAATSFFPAKPLGCYGDGGAVFTDDEGLVEAMRSIRVHGHGSDKYHNDRIGINGRLDTIQAAILLAKMEIFAGEIDMRQEVAARYGKLFSGALTTPHIPTNYLSAWAQYSVLSENRDAVIKSCADEKIPTAIYYPIPLHLQKAFESLGYEKGSMPVSESVAEKIFSLPMHPYLPEEEQVVIVAAMKGD